jgi:hypothetical protein
MPNEIFYEGIGLIAAKEEVTEGTAVVPAAADAFLAEEVKYEPDIQMHPRNALRGDMSPDPDVPGARSGKLTFKTLFKGSGAAGTPPEYGELFKFCKYGETIVASTSVTYAPISFGDPSGTIVVYIQDTATTGKKYVFRGCRGTFKLNMVNGEPQYIEWEFTAADFTESDSAPLSGMSYDSSGALVYKGATVTVAGQALEFHNLLIDAGNQVELREDPAQDSGYLSAIITGCNPVGSFDPQDIEVATYDIFGAWRAGTLGAFSSALNGGAGNIITITAPKVQYTKLTPGVRGGLRILDTAMKFCRDSGNDHLSIAYT